MINKASEIRQIAEDSIYKELNNRIVNTACIGAYQLYLESTDVLCITLHTRPDKQKIFETLKQYGYDVIELNSQTITISWRQTHTRARVPKEN